MSHQSPEFPIGAAETWRDRLIGRLKEVGTSLPWPWVVLVVAVVLMLYYPMGMALVHVIDDDPDFAPPPGAVSAEQSRAVAMAASLVRREIDIHGWTANDPFFQPSWALDNMPAFQQGIVSAISRFAVEMSDQIGRTRGSSGMDADLDKAAGLLKYPGTVWMFDPSTSWAPTASAEKQYRAAARALDRYNARLANGDAVFERRADSLIATLDRMSKDLGSSSAALDRRLGERSLIDTQADDLFYGTKGRLYAYSLLLREMGHDHAALLSERELGGAWEQMLASLRSAAALDPLVVSNASPDGMLLPNHLAVQGFYLLRARTQLSEIADILAK